MSFFGLASLFIALVSITIIVVHSRVMGKRAPIDIHFAKLEDLLRERIELLYSTSPPESPLRDICATCIDLGYNEMVNALPSIADSIEEEPIPHNEEIGTNTTEITSTIESLNTAIQAYNEAITKKPSAALMAMALGLKTEDPIELQI